MPKVKKIRAVSTRRITMPNHFRTSKRTKRINTSYKSPVVFEPEAYEGNQDLKNLLGEDSDSADLTKLLSGDKELKKLFDVGSSSSSASSQSAGLDALKKLMLKGKTKDGVTSESMQRMLFSGTDKFYKPSMGSLGGEDDSLSSLLGMPRGVTNLKMRDKQIRLQQQMQAANAGILDAKTRKLKALAKVLKKRAQEQQKRKAIQFLAETDELDEIPEEFKEEVEDYYYANIPRELRKFVPLEDNTNMISVLPAGASDEDQNLHARLQSLLDSNQKYPEFDNKTIKQVLQERMTVKRNIQERREKRSKKSAQQQWEDAAREARRLADAGLIRRRNYELSGHGLWKAPRLHTLLRPHHIQINRDNDVIDKEREDQNKSLRDEIREVLKRQRGGLTPPDKMIDRSVPKLARPLIRPPSLPPKDPGVFKHPFVFPSHKFEVHSGLK